MLNMILLYQKIWVGLFTYVELSAKPGHVNLLLSEWRYNSERQITFTNQCSAITLFTKFFTMFHGQLGNIAVFFEVYSFVTNVCKLVKIFTVFKI